MMTRRPVDGRREHQDDRMAAQFSRAYVRDVPLFHCQKGAPRLWLFDMDDTLLASSAGILDEVHDLMNDFLIERLGMSPEEASRLREKYWRECGSTFIGLWRYHGVDPRVFLPTVHDFDYTPYLKGLKHVRHLLAQFPGRRVVFTNGPRNYVEHILPALGLKDFFDAEVTSTDMRLFGDWRPKPSVSMLRALCARMDVAPADAVLVDDSLMNLKAARQAGLRTVWCVGLRKRHAGLSTPAGVPLRHCAVDLIVRNLEELVRRKGSLRRSQ